MLTCFFSGPPNRLAVRKVTKIGSSLNILTLKHLFQQTQDSQLECMYASGFTNIHIKCDKKPGNPITPIYNCVIN